MKAKAKAAATAAAKKRAEAKALAEQEHDAGTGRPGAARTTLSSRISSAMGTRARTSVTQYWVDSQSGTLAPGGGGGLLRIGYDQAAFEEAVQEVILAPKSRDEWEKAMRQKRREKAGLTQEEEEQQGEESQQTAETGTEIDDKVTTTTTSVPAPSLAPVNKEHLAFVVQQLEVPERDAKAALRQNQGDVTLALGQLVEPPSREELLASASRSGTRASRLVKV